MLRILAACALACAIVSTAEARPRSVNGLHPECNISFPCIVPGPAFKAEVRGPLQPQLYTLRNKKAETVNLFGGVPYINPAKAVRAVTRMATEILPHPAGCRRNLFCGCGSSVYLGKGVVNAGGLALARNWLGYDRAAPGPGMAEVLRGGRHVRVIEASLGDGLYQFYDPNSGGRLTRRHVGPIRGIVVNPNSTNRILSRYASVM